MSLDASAYTQARHMLEAGANHPPQAVLNSVQRLLGKWRSQLIANTILARDGEAVQSGPFKGMRYTVQAAEGALAPRLLGTYEAELHGFLMARIAEGVETIVDIGCAEGYYAVGLALASPGSRVEAFDIDPEARDKCEQLARDNGVAQRVHVRAVFEGARFADYDRRTLIVLDAEGFEDDLLDPSAYPALERLTLLVETHPGARPGVTERLVARFTASHDVTVAHETLKPPPEGSWLRALPLADQFHATWEWRATPTPWLMMVPRARGAVGAAANP